MTGCCNTSTYTTEPIARFCRCDAHERSQPTLWSMDTRIVISGSTEAHISRTIGYDCGYTSSQYHNTTHPDPAKAPDSIPLEAYHCVRLAVAGGWCLFIIREQYC